MPQSVVFLGGSLTWGANSSDPQRTSFRARMAQYLQQKYHGCPFTFHDAAIGGTGSDLAVFRLERDVLSRQPDLVFVDFTINDSPVGDDVRRLSSYESILRELIERDVLVAQVLMCVANQLGDRFAPATQARYLNHLKLASAYGTAVGDTLTYIQKQLQAGRTRLDILWPFQDDQTHPGDVGYEKYFEAVRIGFEEAIATDRRGQSPPQPLYPDTFKVRQRIRVVDQPLPAGWGRSHAFRTSLWFDGLASRWLDDVAVCHASRRGVIEPWIVRFEGTFVGIIGQMDELGLSFRVSIDGKPRLFGKGSDASTPWQARTPRPGCLLFWHVLADDLDAGPHELQITPIISDGQDTGALHFESVCVAG